MAIALDPARTWDYVLRADRELQEEERTVWKMRTLSQRASMKMVDRLIVSDDGSASMGGMGTQSLDIVLDGLVGWTNFPDSAGEPIEAKVRGGHLTDVSLARIDTTIMLELAIAIESGGKLSEEDTEKPGPSPTE